VCFGGGLDIINLSADSCACDDHYSKFASFFLSLPKNSFVVAVKCKWFTG
jgi:hypothetical protein